MPSTKLVSASSCSPVGQATDILENPLQKVLIVKKMDLQPTVKGQHKWQLELGLNAKLSYCAMLLQFSFSSHAVKQ